ncbi:MAG TPA: ABC transporter permease [Bryobacteraceae bacterium]|nr:ABC transporter permease [Bryobacteraceae bacterium]
MFETTLQDIRYGVRVLLQNLGFSLVAVITLALGIGVNTAIFSLVYGVLLRPLPYQNGSRLVVLHQEAPKTDIKNVPFSAQEIFDYRDHNHTLDAVVEHHSMSFLLLGKDSAERVNTAVVSANFFDVLGIKPLYGRTFVAADEAHGAEAVLILSNEYWKARHGGDPNIVGKVFQMNNRPHRVIGVLPPFPQYPVENDVYMPTSQCPFRSSARAIANRQARLMTAFGRLKPGVTIEQAQADLSTLASQIATAHPKDYPEQYGYALEASTLQMDLTRRARSAFFVLLGAAGFVLLIACANVANLMLARLLKVERELAVRAALGANRSRLIRQLLTESMLLALGGGVIGLALAPNALALLVKFAARFTTRAAEVHIDTPVLLFTLLVSVGTGLVFGLAPALSGGRNLSDALKQGGGRNTVSRGRQRLRAALVIAQVGVSFVLLIGAGLMIRSFVRLQNVNPGFNSTHLLTMRLSPSFTRYRTNEQFQALYKSVLSRVRAVSGVQSVSLATNFPFNAGGIANGPNNTGFEIEGRPASKGQAAPLVDLVVASEDYFATVGQPLIRGRAFTEHDDGNALQVAVINQTMAANRWPTEDPIGKRVSFDNGQHWAMIVGIMGDVRAYGFDRPPGDEIFTPLAQNQFAGNLVVRTLGEPMSAASAIRSALHDVDSQLAVDRVRTMDQLEEEATSSPRVMTGLLGLFAALALLISACGIAAVMALTVTQRTAELGIRMALGASRDGVMYMVVRQGLVLALAGTVVGLAGAFGITRLLASLLYATSPTDLVTFATVSLVFVLVSGLACYIPARDVTAIEPLSALRRE